MQTILNPWRLRHLRAADNACFMGESAPDPTVWIFGFWMAAHVLLWTWIAAVSQPNAPLDMIEMLFWGHEWQLGYHKHPPLPAWTAEAVAVLTGNATWSLYLATQLAVVGSMWAAWRLARELLAPWPALCAAMLLETSYYYNFTTADLNNNLINRPFWSLAVLCLYWALTSGRLRHWLALGVCLALAMLSKYDAAFLVLAMLLLAAFSTRARQALRTPGPYLATAVALLLFVPHLWWMWKHDFVTLRYVLHRSESPGGVLDHVLNPLGFLLSQSGALLPMVLIALPLTGWPWKLRVLPEPERFPRIFLLTMVLGPVGLYTLSSLLLGIHVHSMWGSPLWTFAALALIFSLRTCREPAVCRRVVVACIAASLLLGLALLVRNVSSPYVRHKPSRIHFGGEHLAGEILRLWKRQDPGPLRLVAGPWWEAGNVGFYLAERPTVYGDLSQLVSPWVGDRQLAEEGGVILWESHEGDSTFEAELLHRFPNVEFQPPIVLGWQSGAELPPAWIRVAIIDPSEEDPGDEGAGP